jgi:hypothetical protein
MNEAPIPQAHHQICLSKTNRLGWKCGSSAGVSAQEVRNPEHKSQCCRKISKTKNYLPKDLANEILAPHKGLNRKLLTSFQLFSMYYS